MRHMAPPGQDSTHRPRLTVSDAASEFAGAPASRGHRRPQKALWQSQRVHATVAAAPHVGLAASAATVLWTQIAVLLLLARLLGAAARRLGQPPIVGSLLAGLIA